MLLILTALFLCAFSSSGSFPKPFKKEEEERYLLWLHDEAENVREYAKQQLILHNLRLVAHIAKNTIIYIEIRKNSFLLVLLA